MKNTLITENFRISLNSIRSHLLRTILTILIISFRDYGIGRNPDSDRFHQVLPHKEFFHDGFKHLHHPEPYPADSYGRWPNKQKLYEAISYKQAMEFKEKFFFPGYTSVFIGATGVATIKYKSNKTNPNVRVMGTDENYIYTSGDEIDKGRVFTTG